MSLKTNFNTSPYYDDYSASSNYYRVLFKPGVAVQTRELTQLQSILQNQIEKFGDNIFKRGTIIEGCSLIYHSSLPYIKIKDLEADGTPVNVSLYDKLYLRNSANVTAYVVTVENGFESRSPDLNTLFVKYNSSGENSNTATFAASETLTVYSPDYNIFKMKVLDGSTGFSNSDTIQVVSAIAVQNSTGGSTFTAGAFTVNDTIQNGVANAIIVEANSTVNASALILKIKPLASDLQTANTAKWRFTENETIRNANTANSATIVGVIGSGATGSITTNSLGKITAVSVVDQGSGYYYQPYITASITSNSSISISEINQLDVIGQNYLTNITVANYATNPIGVGYGLSVDEGVIYQKGFFSRVEKQLAIVNKYSNTDFTKSVGFLTDEEIIDSNQDTSLLDNATGETNYAAPGADRLKLTPLLYVLNKSDADANTDFLPIVEFADGQSYKQNKRTVYNILGDEIAKRTYEESGNYVLDQFLLTTKDSSTFSDTASVFKINIDPGVAYIKGYRVETTTNYTANVDKGIDTQNIPTSTIKVGYGNYIKINELGGIFQFNTGEIVDLYDTEANFLTGLNPGSSLATAGTKIGEARMRSLVLDSGEPGTDSATYRLYLFDIVMNPGKNFSNVRSVYYNGTNKGIADIAEATTILYDPQNNGLIFKPVNALKFANNITYTYRSINQSKVANTTGYITLTPGVNESLPYTGELNNIEKRDILVIPFGNYQAIANAPGGITTSATSNVVSGTGSANFLNAFKPGDYVKLANSTASVIKRIVQVTNSTSMTLSSNAGSVISGNAVLYFPNNIPISLTSRSTRTANVAANGQMTIYLANSIANTTGSATSANVAIVYNMTANNVNPATKTANRQIYTRLVLANNAANTYGPWALGVSDAFRLHAVYKATTSNTTLTFNASGIDNANDFIPLTNNPWGVGDSLTYTTSTGNTVITGLVNNTIYLVGYSNTTGIKLANASNISDIKAIAPGSSETGHNLVGAPIHFTPTSYGVTDVTNDFYIDNNQKEDYLDTSYLYLKPRSTTLSNTETLLVKYDAFTSGAGIKTISSYSINDSANLASLLESTNINTLEIPEMVGTDGKYYDIRDQFDFRPSSSNTIPLTSNTALDTIINPSEPSNSGRFSSIEQKFPVPNSTLSANVTYYLARNDRVVLDKNGGFVVVKGIPNVLDTFPSEPKDSLTIQYLRIPPYPSLPFSVSKDTAQIIDTKVANEKYGKRKENFRVATPINKDQRSRIQTKGYRMSDVATLERRISDLEYYVSFTLAEAVAKSRFISSSTDPNLDRYKFGFFVDPFSDYKFADTENTEFWSNISNDQLTPKKTEINLEFFYDSAQNGDVSIDSEGIVTLPYIEHELISQNDATGTTDTVVSNTTTTTSITQIMSTVIESQKNTSRSDNAPYIYDEFYYTFSSITGPVEFYMVHRDNNMATEIFQSTTQNGTWTSILSSAAASAITNSDITNKALSTLNDGRKIEHPGSVNRKGYGPVGGFVEDQHKLTWTHNPVGGLYYKIRVYKGKNHGGQGKSGTYGYKLIYPSDKVTVITPTFIAPSSFGYIGVTNKINPPSFTLTMSYDNIPQEYGYVPAGLYVADSQKFTIEISGLKPLTYHKFFLGEEDKTASCIQIKNGTTNVDGLLTNASGELKLDFYYDAGINEATSDVTQQYKLLASAAGNKIFVVKSIDSTSFATGEISLKSYTGYGVDLINSYGNLNVPTQITQYDYISDFSSVVDTNVSSPTPTYDTNVRNINWDGSTAFVTGFNKRVFGETNVDLV